MTGRAGHRGYITSRPILGNRVPQAVQNLVIRDYAARHRLEYRLSATEYAMPNCFIVLNTVLDELPRLSGMILYSLFMLPAERRHRLEVYRRVLAAGADLHSAVESLKLEGEAGVEALEDIWLVQEALAAAPKSI